MHIVISNTSSNPIYQQTRVITTTRVYSELEKEGLIDSVAGKGFFVASQNHQLLKERQLRVVEDHLGQAAVRGHRIIKQRIIGKTESL